MTGGSVLTTGSTPRARSHRRAGRRPRSAGRDDEDALGAGQAGSEVDGHPVLSRLHLERSDAGQHALAEVVDDQSPAPESSALLRQGLEVEVARDAALVLLALAHEEVST